MSFPSENNWLAEVHSAVFQLDERQRHQHNELLKTLETLTLKIDSLQRPGASDVGMGVSLTLPIESESFWTDETSSPRNSNCDMMRKEYSERRRERNTLDGEETPTSHPDLNSSGHRPSVRATAWHLLNLKVVVQGHEIEVFEYALGLTIFINAVMIGIESNTSLAYQNSSGETNYDIQSFNKVEGLFLGIYYMELLVRWAAGGHKALCKGCVLFDILLVLLGTASVIATSLVDIFESFDSPATALQPILVLRLLRFLRLLRTLRFISYFKILWKLVFGLVQSSSAMASTMVLLLMSIYIAACGAVELISKDAVLRSDLETRTIIDKYFCDVETIMLLFIQFVTMDSLASIYFPIVKLRPGSVFFFLSMIVIVSIALLNLVTVVLVEAAIETGNKDKEILQDTRRRLRPLIATAFHSMDEDQDGFLTRAEVAMSRKNLPAAIVEIVSEDKLAELFNLLDVDDSDQLSEYEFVNGIMRVVLSDASFDSLHNMRILRKMKSLQDRLLVEVQCVQHEVKCIERQLGSIGTNSPKLNLRL